MMQTMNFSRGLVRRSLALACAASTCGAAHAQYTSKLLNPSGASVSRAWAAYNGREVGNAGGSSIQTAALWSGTPASAIPLTNAGWGISYAFGLNANEQVGMASGAPTGFGFHAMLWTGSAASMIDLNPPGYDVSAAWASDGTYQVGQATAGGIIHAIRWTGTPESAVDLNPDGYDTSHAYGAWNGMQVGVATLAGVDHAMLWSGSPESAVDLNGSFDSSDAYAMDGTHQVGVASGTATGGANHAVMWSGTAASVVDLHPAGLSESFAEGIGNGVVAGYGAGPSTNNKVHAFAWVNGVAIDLHPFLPAGYSSSHAYGVDPVTGQIVGEAVNNLNRALAFMWTPVVPGAFSLSAPADGSIDLSTTPTLSWTASAGATSYAVTIATDPGLTSVVASASGVVGTSWTVPATLLAECGNYYWGVKAQNAVASTSSTPSDFGFATHIHADVTHDGTVDLADFFEFFNCFDISAPCADTTGDGEVDLADFFDFFNVFDQGGC